MRRDALVDLSEETEPVARRPTPPTTEEAAAAAVDLQVDWASYIPGVQRVLHMSVRPFPLCLHSLEADPAKPAEHLAYLVDSLRVEHLYCFWCAAKYGSVQEMEGPGGCPGTEEDDH